MVLVRAEPQNGYGTESVLRFGSRGMEYVVTYVTGSAQ